MAEITTFQAGFCTHKSCMAVKGSGWHTCQFPANVALIEAANRYWLWDTGYSQHFYRATQRGLFSLYRQVTPVFFEEKDAIAYQLNAIGLGAHNLSGIILSHFHGDHIAGLKDFPKTPFICSGLGWQKLRHLKGITALINGFVPDLVPDDFEQRVIFIESYPQTNLPAQLMPLTQAHVVPESKGELLLIDLPGHALGHIGALVATDDGWVLLAGDAAWSKANYRELRYPSKLTHLIMDSSQQFYTSLQILHQLDQQQIPIILSHEKD